MGAKRFRHAFIERMQSKRSKGRKPSFKALDIDQFGLAGSPVNDSKQALHTSVHFGASLWMGRRGKLDGALALRQSHDCRPNCRAQEFN